jgi:signal peptidase II
MFYLIIIFWIITDLATKKLASLYLNEKINIFFDIIYLKYIENKWIAFSIQIPHIKIITIILIILLISYYFKEEKKKKNKYIDISFALIIAWGLANAYERIVNSYVVDFIWIKYFAIFNIADSLIFIWISVYLYIIYKINYKK